MKKNISILIIIVIIASTLFCFAGCNNQNKIEGETRVITDVLGREVEIPKEIKSVVCVGCGALRLTCYADAADLVVGVEDLEMDGQIRRPYSFVNQEKFKDLPRIGKGGGAGYTAYDEELIMLNPDVILCAYTADALEKLAKNTNIPVVAINYRSNIFDENIVKSLNLLGDILNKKERCDKVINYFEQTKKDLNNRTKNIKDEDKPSVYVGAISFSGAHGFTGTYGQYSPLDAINAKNVADETGKTTGFEVDPEKIQEWQPDYVFLDISNLNLVNAEFDKNLEFFNSLNAVKNNNVYGTISYNWYTTNIELALANSYYMGKIIYPDAFKDIDISEKTNELFENFLGQKIYNEYEKINMQFGSVQIGK